VVVLFLSARQFGDERRVDPLRDRLAEEGLAAEPLRLELTETTVMADIDALRAPRRPWAGLRVRGTDAAGGHRPPAVAVVSRVQWSRSALISSSLFIDDRPSMPISAARFIRSFFVQSS
jgi:hypothetical protein